MCLGLPDAFALEQGQGNHTPSQGESPRQGEGLRGPVQRRHECEHVIRQVEQDTRRPGAL